MGCAGPRVTAWTSASTHVCTHNTRAHTCTLQPLPFWCQGRNQGQGTLAVLLGGVSGQQENLSKVRLQTSSAEGWTWRCLGLTCAGSGHQPRAGPSPWYARPSRTPAALTGGRGQAAHVAVAFLAVRLPALQQEIRDLGAGALGAGESSCHPCHPHPCGDSHGFAQANTLCHAVP